MVNKASRTGKFVFQHLARLSMTQDDQPGRLIYLAKTSFIKGQIQKIFKIQLSTALLTYNLCLGGPDKWVVLGKVGVIGLFRHGVVAALDCELKLGLVACASVCMRMCYVCIHTL